MEVGGALSSLPSSPPQAYGTFSYSEFFTNVLCAAFTYVSFAGSFFCAYVLGLYFSGIRLLAQKLCVERWRNWTLISFRIFFKNNQLIKAREFSRGKTVSVEKKSDGSRRNFFFFLVVNNFEVFSTKFFYAIQRILFSEGTFTIKFV